MQADPAQTKDVARENVTVVNIMRQEYKEWYADVSKRFGEFCEIVLGSPKEDPVRLTCHDWHGPNVPWNQTHILRRLAANGFWAVQIERAGQYEFTLRERPGVARFAIPPGIARLKIGGVDLSKPVPAGMSGIRFAAELKAGKTRLETWISERGGGVRGAYFVDVKYLGPPAEK